VLKRKMIVLSLVVLMLISVGFSGVVGAMGYHNERSVQKDRGLELALEQGLITETEYDELITEREERREENRAERAEDGSREKNRFSPEQ
jgi:cell division protein FtsB